MSSILPPVRATLQERYLFNFRMPPEVFQHFMPVPWLPPHLINNQAIISFCTLQLRHITVAPLPTVVGLSSVSCAYRYAVLDATQPTPSPAVFVPARYTNNPFGSWFTHLGFSAPQPLIHAQITSTNSATTLNITHPNGCPIFHATVQQTSSCDSALFDSASTFARFIKAGVTSYGTSIRGTRLTKIDLHKTETVFEPLTVSACEDSLLRPYTNQGMVLDSAFRTAGGQYEWVYHGLVSADQPQTQPQ